MAKKNKNTEPAEKQIIIPDGKLFTDLSLLIGRAGIRSRCRPTVYLPFCSGRPVNASMMKSCRIIGKNMGNRL